MVSIDHIVSELLVLFILFCTDPIGFLNRLLFHNMNFDFSSFLSTLVGAGVGAYTAYRFQEFRDKKVDKKRYYESILKAMFVLKNNYNQICNFREKHLDPLSSDPVKWMKVKPITIIKHDERIETNELLRLVPEGESQMFGKITTSQSNYDLVFRLISDFNTVCGYKNNSPTLRTYIENSMKYNELSVEEQFIFDTLKNACDNLYQIVDNLIQSYQDLIPYFIRYGSNSFKHASFEEFKIKVR